MEYRVTFEIYSLLLFEVTLHSASTSKYTSCGVLVLHVGGNFLGEQFVLGLCNYNIFSNKSLNNDLYLMKVQSQCWFCTLQIVDKRTFVTILK